MYLRYLYGAISTVIRDGSNLEQWDLLCEHSHHIMLEFTYWLTRIRGNTAVLYHRPFWFIPIHLFVATGYTYALSDAVGSVVLSHTGENFVEPSYWTDNATPQAGNFFAEHGHVVDVCLLTEEQRKKSSTLRELLGLIRMCMVHLHTWRGHCIRVFVDNAALAKIMIRGSRIPELHLLVRKLVDMLTRFNIRTKVIWIPRKLNRGSDTMSKTKTK